MWKRQQSWVLNSQYCKNSLCYAEAAAVVGDDSPMNSIHPSKFRRLDRRSQVPTK